MKWTERVRASLFLKIILLFLAAHITIGAVGYAVHRYFGLPHHQKSINKNMEHYSRYLAKEIGTPVDTLRAPTLCSTYRIHLRMNVDSLQWASDTIVPGFSQLAPVSRLTSSVSSGVYKEFFYVLLQPKNNRFLFLFDVDTRREASTLEWRLLIMVLVMMLILTIIYFSPLTQGCTKGVNPRVGQYGSGHFSFIANLIARRIVESSDKGVFRPVLINGPGIVNGHGLPCFSTIVRSKPLQTGTAGNIHLGIDLGGFHTLGQFILTGQIGSGGFVEVADQVDIPEVKGRSIVTHAGAETSTNQNVVSQIGQTLFLGRDNGIPCETAISGVFPDQVCSFRYG